MQTAQGIGVVAAYILVASAGHFLAGIQKIQGRMHHPRIKVVIPDAMPLSMWFWIALGVFTICLIGTLLYVKEPSHNQEADEEARLVDTSVA